MRGVPGRHRRILACESSGKEDEAGEATRKSELAIKECHLKQASDSSKESQQEKQASTARRQSKQTKQAIEASERSKQAKQALDASEQRKQARQALEYCNQSKQAKQAQQAIKGRHQMLDTVGAARRAAKRQDPFPISSGPPAVRPRGRRTRTAVEPTEPITGWVNHSISLS